MTRSPKQWSCLVSSGLASAPFYETIGRPASPSARVRPPSHLRPDDNPSGSKSPASRFSSISGLRRRPAYTAPKHRLRDDSRRTCGPAWRRAQPALQGAPVPNDLALAEAGDSHSSRTVLIAIPFGSGERHAGRRLISSWWLRPRAEAAAAIVAPFLRTSGVCSPTHLYF
jgi:hypothetical protein